MRKKLFRRSGFFSAKDKVYEGKSNDKQSKCSSSSIYKLIDLLQAHVDFLSKIIPRYKEIITARIFHVKSKREVENGTAKNQTTEALAQKAAYILKAGFENKRLIRNYNNRFSLRILSILLIIVLFIGNILPLPIFAQEQASSSAIVEEKEATASAAVEVPPVTPSPPSTPLFQPPIKSISLSELTNAALLDGSSRLPSALVRKQKKLRRLSRKDFKAEEAVTVVVENAAEEELSISVSDSKGNAVEGEIETLTSGDMTTIQVFPPRRHFTPGKYTVTIHDSQTNESFQQDFTWGVLAINTNKSIYHPKETARLSLAVLDERGEMVCDAKLELRIKNQESRVDETLSTENGKIQVTPGCSKKELLLTPDYQAAYQVQEKGIYHMELTAQTKNGTYTITDSFAVQEEVPFDVERISATRIYPPLNYPVRFTITANQDFTGTITETVPDSFTITPLEGTQSFDMAAKKSVEPPSHPGVLQSRTIGSPGDSIASPSATPVKQADSFTPFSPSQNDNTNETASSSATPISSDSAKLQEDTLGAFTQKLSLPFLGEIPITLGFGQEPDDPFLLKMYQKFGVKAHDGVDFALPEGTEVLAAERGTVVQAGRGDYGITVVLEHSFGKSYYGHLQKVLVEVGQVVEKGSVVGISGSTGLSTGPHLHFGIKPKYADTGNGYKGKIDPSSLLGFFNTQAVLGVSTSSFDSTIKVLTWEVSIRKGETITLGYQFKAPQISPQFYTLGPLRFTQSAEPGRNQPGLAGRQTSQPRLNAASGSASFREVFQEARQWMIAADVAIANYLDSGSTAIGTSETSIGSLTTSNNFGTNIVIASIFISNTSGTQSTIDAGNLKLKKGSGCGAGSGTLLDSNSYQMSLATTNRDHLTPMIVYRDTNSVANETYCVTALINAGGGTTNGEVKMVVFNNLVNSGYNDGASTSVSSTEVSLGTTTMANPGDNVIITTIQTDTAVDATIAADAVKITKGGSTVASNQFQVRIENNNTTELKGKYILLAYRDANAAANVTYDVRAAISAACASCVMQASTMIINGVSSAFSDSGSVALGTTDTNMGSLTASFLSGNNVVIAINQFDNGKNAPVTVSAGNARVEKGTCPSASTLSSNQFLFKLKDDGTSQDSHFHSQLYLDSNAAKNSTYCTTAAVDVTPVNGEQKLLVIGVEPTLVELMRHGKYFTRDGKRRPFTF